MRFHTFVSAAVAATAVIVPALPTFAQTAVATLKDASGKDVGSTEFIQTAAGVLLKVKIAGLTPGVHGIHVHAVGKCDAPFASAGGHFNPGGDRHGLMAGIGHAGDMPNLHVPASGQLALQILNPKISLTKGDGTTVFDADGSSLVIHAGADDYRSDPAGNSGDRIACGVITEAAAPAGPCKLYEVTAGLVNVSREPRGDGTFKDVLEGGEVACLGRTQANAGTTWGHVDYKLRGLSDHVAIEGWVDVSQMTELTADQLEAIKRKLARLTAPAPGQAGGDDKPAPPPLSPEDMLRFDQTIVFGPFPVNGSTVQKLAQGTPLFPPIEGLPDTLWKDKNCSSCHRWDHDALCTQGGTYVKNPASALRHPHPYGGAYKIALMRWARSGCQ